MAQFLRPTSDFTNIGPFTNEGGSQTDLWQSIDETVASDADYVESPTNPAGTERYAAALSSPTNPAIDTGHVVRYRLAKNANAGRGIDVNVVLIEDVGGTDVTIATWLHTNISNTPTTFTQTLSTGEASAIGNYANLRVRFDPTATGGGQGRTARLYWVEMEVPDPPPNFPRSATDTTSVTDSLSRRTTAARTPADSIAIGSDAPNAIVAGIAYVYDLHLEVPGAVRLGGAFTVTATDSVTTADTVARAVGVKRTATDTTSVTDSPVRVIGRRPTATDTTSVTEGLVRRLAATKTAADTTSVTDSITKTAAHPKALADSVPFVGDSAGSNGSVYRRPLDDASVQSESLVSGATHFRSHADSVTGIDTVTRAGTFTRAVTQSTTVGDAVNGQRRNATQFVRPDGDLSGNWHGEDARTTSLFTSVDDAPFNDATYVESPNNPTSTDFAEFALGDAGDPGTSVGHVVRYRYSASGSSTLVVELRQGTTVIASWTHVDPPATPTLATQTLSEAQADAITDYTDLRIRVRAA